MPAAKKTTKTNTKTAKASATSKKAAVKKPAKASAKKETSATKAVKKTKASPQEAKKATKKAASSKTSSVKKVEKKAPAKKAATAEKAAPKKVVKTDVFRCPISGIPVKAEKPNLTDKTLEKLRELLLEERVKHVAQAAELHSEAVDMIVDREAGDTQFDEESGEGDSVAVERERTLFLAAEAENTVELIDAALERMKKGTYGLCSPSSRRISVARLEALPWTEVCVDCKARSERRR